MDIELLSTFLEVNKTRHFGKAADNLYLTQAAVSARVKQLEDSLKVRLFVRARNNIQLTPEGERLIPYAESMLSAWSHARQDVKLEQEQRTQFSMGTTSGLWRFLLQKPLTALTLSFPGLMFRAEAHERETLLHLLQEGLLDMIVLFDTATTANLATHKLGKLKLVLMTTSTGVSLPQALSNYIYVDWGMAFSLFHRKRVGDPVDAVLQTNMAEVAIDTLHRQGGAAYLPAALLQMPNIGLYPVDGAPGFAREVCMLYRVNSPRIERSREVISSFVSSITDILDATCEKAVGDKAG